MEVKIIKMEIEQYLLGRGWILESIRDLQDGLTYYYKFESKREELFNGSYVGKITFNFIHTPKTGRTAVIMWIPRDANDEKVFEGIILNVLDLEVLLRLLVIE